MTEPTANFDPNRVAAEVVSTIVKEFVENLKPSIAALSRNISSHLKTFSYYLEKTYERCSSVRIIIDKDRSYDISNVYVPTNYTTSNKTIKDNDLIQAIRDRGRVVVLGFGGIGKTIFMKHSFVSILNNPIGKVPVFVELRRLNEMQSIDLQTYIRTSISDKSKTIDEESFEILCRDGRFIFLFDAFDELNEAARDKVQSEILRMGYEYPKLSIAVSSRNDNRFYAWGGYDIFHAQKFTKEQIINVIKTVDFDKDIKKKFLSNIISKKFDSFADFLSTPLLALMMLLTYRQFADIPEKVHIFYRYAFQTHVFAT